MNARFLSSSDKKHIFSVFADRFGITTFPSYLLIETGKQKIRAFSGSLNREDLVALGSTVRVEIVGAYFARRDEHGGIRLSFDAPHLIGKATEHVLELTEAQKERWLRGDTLEIETEPGMYIVRFGKDELGCGHSNGQVLFNYVPRERQIKSKKN